MRNLIQPTALLVLALGFASLPTAAEPPLPELSENCEVALALSALPAYLRDRASTWVLGAKGYELSGDPAADFSCLVARNHRDSIIPQCFDRPGQRAILPRFLDEGRLLRGGADFAQLKSTVDARLARGDYQPANKPGLVYMMSAYNYIFGERAQKVLHIHPHVMFHAPHLKAEDVGNSFGQAMQNHGLPFVIDEGVHGYMISMVEHASDSSDVDVACDGQLPPAPDRT